MNLKKYVSDNPFTVAIIGINIVVFVALNIFSGLSDLFLLNPNFNVVLQRPWTIVTVFFSHQLPIHILLNMFLVFVFGTSLSKEVNPKVVLYVYLLCGFIGSIASLLYAPLIGYEGDLIAGA